MNLSDEELDDLIDFWHLQYTGDLGLEEFMAEKAGWTVEQTRTWLATAQRP